MSQARPWFRKEVFFLGGLTASAVLLYSVVNLARHARFETYMYDLGQVDQVLWKASRLYVPYSTVTKLPPLVWSRHLDLTFYFQVPFYWLWSDVRMYLILEPLVFALGVFPVYFFTRKKLGQPLALVISFSYLFSLGAQLALGYPGHMDIRLATFLSFLFYFLFTGNEKMVYLFAFLSLLTKENAAVYLTLIGAVTVFSLKKKKLGSILIVSSVLFLVLVSGYLFSPQCAFWDWYTHLGRGPGEVFGSLLSRPIGALRLLIFPAEKVKTVFWLLFSFGLLPLLSPELLLVSLPMFAERFLSNRPDLWILDLHYDVLTVPVFIWATIRGLERLKIGKNKQLAMFAFGGFFVCLLAATVFHKTPLTKLFDSQFFQPPSYLQATRKMISQIPGHATLEAQEDLFPHLSHRDYIYALGEGGAVEYIALDVNLFAAQRGGKDKYLVKLINDPNYGLIFCEEGAILFGRGKKDKAGLCPEVGEFIEIFAGQE